MADKKKNENQIDALYQWLSYDLKKIKEELMTELKLSSVQMGHLYQGIVAGKDAGSIALEQEIRYSYKQNQNIYEGLAVLLKTEVAERLNAMDEKIATLEQLQAILSEISDLKYNHMQLQALYESLSSVLSGEVSPKLDTITEGLDAVNLGLEKIVDEEGVRAIVEESVSSHSQQVLEAVAEIGDVKTIVEESLAAYSQPILDAIANKEDIKTLVEESATVHSQKIVDAVATIPTAENVDYARITDEVGDKLLEVLNSLKAEEKPIEFPEIKIPEIDYEKMAGDTSAKVLESLPYPESVDYNRIEAMIANAVAKAVDVNAIATALADKLVLPNAQVEVDYEELSTAVAQKVVAPETAVDYDALAELVIEKLAEKGLSADVVLDAEGVEKVAEAVADKVNKTDDESVSKIVDGVAEELRNMTLVCEYAPEEVVEEATEEVVEEPVVEETVEEVVEEEPVVEAVEEPIVETAEEIVEEPVVEETPVEEELAIAVEPIYEEDLDGQLIDAETGLVVRLKRSFAAKMKQSEEQVKVYYSDIKNALTSYKRINSNVSWHGDRFNFGRDTVAKIGINGKTLCFYLALDPNDPELKTTVYHQKDVGAQKAYESTPFMVKVKSDAAAKKALRLVEVLANKLEAEHDESFEEVDYVAEFAYASTKSLFEAGDIKATKEKKVDFNF